jgi:hypothetical protein
VSGQLELELGASQGKRPVPVGHDRVRFTPSVMGACVLLLLLVVLLHIRAGGHAQWIAAGGTEHVDTEQRLWSQAQAIVERWSGVGGDPNPGANCSAGADGSLCELSCFTLPPTTAHYR